MKYQWRRNYSLILALVMGLWSVGAAVLLRSKLQVAPLNLRILMIVLFLLMLALEGYFLYLAFRSGAYAMIEDDGIRIFSPKAGELASVAWTDVRREQKLSDSDPPLRCGLLRKTAGNVPGASDAR